MANESAPNTRTIFIQWDALVTNADPTWRRDLRLQPEFNDIRPHVKADWTTRGAYASE